MINDMIENTKQLNWSQAEIALNQLRCMICKEPLELSDEQSKNITKKRGKKTHIIIGYCFNILKHDRLKYTICYNLVHEPDCDHLIDITIKNQKARKKLEIKKKLTIPELMMINELTNLQIKYEIKKSLFGHPDIFIKPNICIFVDGEYWHNRPDAQERDKRVNTRLVNDGYLVIRLLAPINSHNFDVKKHGMMIHKIIKILPNIKAQVISK